MPNDASSPTAVSKTEMLQISLLAHDRILVLTEQVAKDAEIVANNLKNITAEARDSRRELEAFLEATGDLPDPSTRLGA